MEGYITLKTALLAKLLGFDWECDNVYENSECVKLMYYEGDGTGYTKNGNSGIGTTEIDCTAPTQSLLHRWLREEYNIDVVITPERFKDGINYCVQAEQFDLSSDDSYAFVVKGSSLFNDNGEYPAYELAMEKGLYEGLKLIE